MAHFLATSWPLTKHQLERQQQQPVARPLCTLSRNQMARSRPELWRQTLGKRSARVWRLLRLSLATIARSPGRRATLISGALVAQRVNSTGIIVATCWALQATLQRLNWRPLEGGQISFHFSLFFSPFLCPFGANRPSSCKPARSSAKVGPLAARKPLGPAGRRGGRAHWRGRPSGGSLR